MRYYVKLDMKGYPVSGSLVYTMSRPNNGRWFELERICPNEDGLCIQPDRPEGYLQKVKYYYVTDECCHPIAGSNIAAYCTPPTGNYFEFFPSCLIKICPPFSAGVIILDAILCYDGEATVKVVAVGGVPPYTGTGIFTISAGTTIYTVTDSEGTTVTTSIVLSQPPELTASGTYPPILVNGGTTTITVTAAGGTPPYTYSLNGGASQSSGVFTDVPAGTPYVIVTDANGCTTTVDFDITQPTSLVSIISILQSIKCNGDLAEVEVTATGGTPPYTGTGIYNVPAQSGYTVQVTDSLGNIAQQTPINITQPDVLVIQNVIYTPIPVFGGTTSLSVTTTGGTPPYLYSLDGITYVPNPINNVTAGNYTLYVKDANDCTDSIPLEITQPPEELGVCYDCAPTLTDVTDPGVGLLSVGNMISSACTLGDYVIDWYLDSITNPTQFISGNAGNTDPAIQEFHPFTGNAARPSQGGSWIPVIRYAFFNGIKYTSSNVPGETYAPDLATCLEPITVENLNCTNGNTPTQMYTHSIQYTAVIQNQADATRTFRFDLGAAVNYFAWKFYGYNVSDKIEFYYVSGATQTLLGQYAIGFDVFSFDVTGPVKLLPLGAFKEVFDLSAIPFVTGDYLSVVITSSYADPNNRNTDWRFECRCLETFDCSNYAPPEIDPCSVTIAYNSVTCTHDISYSFTSFPVCANDRCAYLLEGGVNGVYISQYPSSFNLNASYQIPYGQYCQMSYQGYTNCVNGSLKTLSKTGNVYTINFTDGAEYLLWKNDYLAKYAILNPGYDPSTTNINHYRFIIVKYLIDGGLLGCGDNLNYKDIGFHITSPVTFDDVNFIMEIDVVNTVNNMPPLCGASCTSTINQGISYVANALLEPDFAPISSTVRPYEFIYISYSINTVNATTATGNESYYHLLPYTISNYVCSAEANCVRDFGGITAAEYYVYGHIVFITDLDDALNNFRITSKVDSNGCLIADPANYVTLYEIANGVVITPTGGCP